MIDGIKDLKNHDAILPKILANPIAIHPIPIQINPAPGTVKSCNTPITINTIAIQ